MSIATPTPRALRPRRSSPPAPHRPARPWREWRWSAACRARRAARLRRLHSSPATLADAHVSATRDPPLSYGRGVGGEGLPSRSPPASGWPPHRADFVGHLRPEGEGRRNPIAIRSRHVSGKGDPAGFAAPLEPADDALAESREPPVPAARFGGGLMRARVKPAIRRSQRLGLKIISVR